MIVFPLNIDGCSTRFLIKNFSRKKIYIGLRIPCQVGTQDERNCLLKSSFGYKRNFVVGDPDSIGTNVQEMSAAYGP